MTTTNSILGDQVLTSQLMQALLWEGEKPIPFHFDEPLRKGLHAAITELYWEEHSKDKKN